LPVCLERPFKTPLRPFVILGAITGYAPHRRRHLRELEKGSTDYSTWHVDPEVTGEEGDRLQRRGIDASRALRVHDRRDRAQSVPCLNKYSKKPWCSEFSKCITTRILNYLCNIFRLKFGIE